MVLKKKDNKLVVFLEESEPIEIDLPNHFRGKKLYPAIASWNDNNIEVIEDVK